GQGQHGARHHYRPPGGIDRPELKAVAGIPEQMADAPAKMQEEAEGAADEQSLSQPRSDEPLYERVGLRPGGCGNQPDDQRDGVGTQDDTRQPMSEGQNGGQLGSIDLKVGGEGARAGF